MKRKKKEGELQKVNRTLEALNHSSQAMMRATEEQAYLEEVCKIMVEDCGHAMVWIGFAENDEAKSVRPVAHAGFEQGYLQTLKITWADTERGRGPTGTAIRTGQPSGCRNMHTDPTFAPWRAQALKRGYQSSMVVPLLAKGQAFGAITLYSKEPDPFTDDEVKLLTQLADDLAYGISAVRLRQENTQANAQLQAEVAERQRAQEALQKINQELEQRVAERTAEVRKNWRFLEAFFHHSMDSLVFLDKHFNFIRVNEAYAKACQREVSDFPGHNHFEFYPHAENQGIFENVVRTKTPYMAAAKAFEFPDHPEWGVTYWDWTLVPALDAQGEVDFLVFSLRDVTEREQMDQALRATNASFEAELAERIKSQETIQQLAAIVESSDDAIIGKTLEGMISSWNYGAERMYGYTAQETIGKPFAMLVAPNRPNEVPQILQRIRRGEQIEHYETVRVRKDGQLIDVSLSISPIKDAAGQIVGASTITRDITEHKRMEEGLRTASRYARSLIEASLDPLVTISPEGQITDVNQATELATGLDRAHLIGSDFSLYFTEPQQAKEGYRKVIAEGFVRDYPLTLRHVSGRTMDVLYNASVYRNEAGEVQGVFAAARDITERKRMEEEIKTASLYARSLIEASLDPLVTISPQGKITDVNGATERVTGISREQLIGSDFSDYFTDPQKAAQGYRKVLAEGLVQDYPLTIRHLDGHTIDVLYNATVYRNESGQVQGVFAAARDITERRLAEKRRDVTNALLALFAQKASAHEYLEAVVEVIREWAQAECLGIRLLDKDSNMPYEASYGFAPEFLKLEGKLSLKTDNCCCIRAAQGHFEEQEWGVITSNGSFRCDNAGAFIDGLTPTKKARYRGNCVKFGFASLAVIPIRDRDEVLGLIHLADKRPGHFSPATVEFLESMSPLIGEAVRRFQAETELANYRDHLEELVGQRTSELESANALLHTEITERKRAEEALRQVAQELARSNLDLEQFAYVASHDLQEPLRAVAGYVGLLQKRYPQMVDAKGQHYIESATDGALRMQRLIEDLLAFSRVQTKGKTFAPANLGAALEHALRNLQFTIHETGAEVTSDPLPTLRVDASQIAQLFQNLIGNGMKFRGDTPPKIHIAAQHREDQWTLSVSDNGIGIESQYFDRIFQIFQRLHTRKTYPGTGIGLAICKKIVERHGGKIWIESQPGQGSTFYFTLPDNPNRKS